MLSSEAFLFIVCGDVSLDGNTAAKIKSSRLLVPLWLSALLWPAEFSSYQARWENDEIIYKILFLWLDLADPVWRNSLTNVVCVMWDYIVTGPAHHQTRVKGLELLNSAVLISYWTIWDKVTEWKGGQAWACSRIIPGLGGSHFARTDWGVSLVGLSHKGAYQDVASMSVTGRVSDVSKAQWWLTPRTMREPRPWSPPSPTGGGSASCTGTRPSTTGNFTAGSLTWGAWEEQVEVEVEAPLPRHTSVLGGRTMTGTPCKYRDHTPHTSHLTLHTSQLTLHTSHITLHTLHLTPQNPSLLSWTH